MQAIKLWEGHTIDAVTEIFRKALKKEGVELTIHRQEHSIVIEIENKRELEKATQ